MRKILAAGVIMVVIGLVCPMAYGEGPNKTDSDEWQFSITPYLWAVGLNGDMTVKGVDSDVDVSFSDILTNLDIALEAHFEVWKGRWGGLFRRHLRQAENRHRNNGQHRHHVNHRSCGFWWILSGRNMAGWIPGKQGASTQL